MERLFLFNPENDIALAAGKAGFTPPKNAAELHRRGAMLLWWLGAKDDAVLVDECDLEVSRYFASELESQFGVGPEVVSGIRGREVSRFVPWGWSANTLKQFERAGACFDQEEYRRMERIRQLSHRRSSIVLNTCLNDIGIGALPPLPKEVYGVDELRKLIDIWGKVYVKAPWSSTGRGVICSVDMSADELLRRTEGTIRRQGSVLVEKGLEKVVDFAMLFNSEAGNVTFYGYSLFFNGHGSAYGGNLLLTDEEIEDRLSKYVPREMLIKVADGLCRALRELVTAEYQGCFGIDMMVVKTDDGAYGLAPCVELNLRLTMGVVAHRLVERFGSGTYGRLLVAPLDAASDNSLWLVPQNESYFIGLV